MIFDIETDGLRDEATKIWCLSYKTPDGVKVTSDYGEMRRLLTSAKALIGHSIITFDVPVAERLLDIKIEAQLIDTLALSWYLNHKICRVYVQEIFVVYLARSGKVTYG